MNIGDLVTFKDSMSTGDTSNWGIGLVIGFVDSGLPNHYPWIVVFWGKWKATSRGPSHYFKGVDNENKER